MAETRHPYPHRPEPPRGVQPPEVPRERLRQEDPARDPRREDGELPGMPTSRDPLLNPGPTPD